MLQIVGVHDGMCEILSANKFQQQCCRDQKGLYEQLSEDIEQDTNQAMCVCHLELLPS